MKGKEGKRKKESGLERGESRWFCALVWSSLSTQANSSLEGVTDERREEGKLPHQNQICARVCAVTTNTWLSYMNLMIRSGEGESLNQLICQSAVCGPVQRSGKNPRSSSRTRGRFCDLLWNPIFTDDSVTCSETLSSRTILWLALKPYLHARLCDLLWNPIFTDVSVTCSETLSSQSSSSSSSSSCSQRDGSSVHPFRPHLSVVTANVFHDYLINTTCHYLTLIDITSESNNSSHVVKQQGAGTGATGTNTRYIRAECYNFLHYNRPWLKPAFSILL